MYIALNYNLLSNRKHELRDIFDVARTCF